MPLIRRLLLALALLLAPVAAHAACQVSNGSATFAASSSYAVQANSVAQIVAPAGFSCNGSLITVVGSSYARATVTSANGFRLVGPTGDRIAYAASADANGAYPFTQGGTVDYFNPTLLSLLTILNGGTFSPKFYATIGGGANVAAGTYIDTLTVQWSWNVCHGVGAGNVCVLGETGSGTATIQVSITVGKDCRITAPAVSFGSASLVSQFSQITQSVLVDCSKGAGFNVGFTSGTAASARPWRTMTDGAGHVLQYNLYKSDGATIWDETNPQAATTPGAGATSPSQAFTYRARINPDQQTPVAGSYTDTVSVVVTF